MNILVIAMLIVDAAYFNKLCSVSCVAQEEVVRRIILSFHVTEVASFTVVDGLLNPLPGDIPTARCEDSWSAGIHTNCSNNVIGEFKSDIISDAMFGDLRYYLSECYSMLYICSCTDVENVWNCRTIIYCGSVQIFFIGRTACVEVGVSVSDWMSVGTE